MSDPIQEQDLEESPVKAEKSEEDLKKALYAAEAKSLMLAMDNQNLRERLSKHEAVEVIPDPDPALIRNKEVAMARAGELISELGGLMSGLNLLNLDDS